MLPHCLLPVLLLAANDLHDPSPASASEAQDRPTDEAEPPPADGAHEAPRAQIPEMIVTGTIEQTGVPKVPLDATGSRDVLGPDEIEGIGARELNDLIQYLPAVSTRPYNGGESSAPSFSMRGLPDDGLTEYILVMIDGVPANPMPYGWTAFSFFPLMPQQVHAIDLIRGGYSVRYSPNTVGGVLNLITPPIPTTETYTVDAVYGANNYVSTLLTAGNDDGRFGYHVTFGASSGDGYRDDAGFEYKTVDLRTRWTYAEDDWLALRASVIDNEHRPPGGLTQAQFEEDRFGNARPNNQFDGYRVVGDFVRHVGTDDGFYEFFGWASQTRRKLQGDRPSFGPVTEHRVVDDDAYSAALGIRAQKAVSLFGVDHELYYGVRASQELLPNRTTVSQPIPPGPPTELQDASYQLTALSAHIDDTVQVTEDWQVVGGVRAEWIPIAKGEEDLTDGDYDDEFFDLLPGLSTSYELTDEVALFANYQRSFRAPQVFGFDVSGAGIIQDLSFEHGQSWEVGVRTELGSGVTGSAALWHTDFDDVGVFETGVYRTIGNIESDGIDFVLRWDAGMVWEALRGFSVYASYTTQDSEIVDAVDPANDGNETPYAWEDKAAWSFQYETQNLWRFALSGVYVGESYSDDANTEAENADGNLGLNDSRVTWDAQISKTFGTDKALIRAYVGATNVFDEDWFVHSRGGFFGGGKVAGPPRQAYVGLSFSL